MYLPVPLLREFGWLGFLLFAIPNVAGCVAFGYLASPQRSRRFLLAHPRLVSAFSAVTVAYHAFFVGFVGGALLGPEDAAAPGTRLMLLVLLGLTAWALSAIRSGKSGSDGTHAGSRTWPLLGAAAFAASLALFALLGTRGLSEWSLVGPKGAVAAAWLLPTMCFGFLLCPWLDLSFHRARREAPSPHAFLLFGAAFATMLLFSAAYAPQAATGLPGIVVLHMALQGIFTSAVHLRELGRLGESIPSGASGARDGGPDGLRGASSREPWNGAGPRLAVAAILAAGLLGVIAGTESNYLRILAFYGLLFPGALLVFGGRSDSRSTRMVLPFIVIIAASLPLMELGFIDLRTALLPWPIALLLAARLLRRRRRR